MAKTTAPLLGFGASGQIGKSNVHASWKGIKYTRQYVIPSNPNSAEQQLTRNIFSWLTSTWKIAPSLAQAPFTAYAKGKPLTDRNAFNKFNIAALRGATDLDDFVFSPGAHGGVPTSITSITPAATTLTVNCALPAAPSAWTYVKTVAVCIKAQDPTMDDFWQMYAGQDLTTGYAPIITGLVTGTTYRVGAMMQWLNGLGQEVWSPSVSQDGTTS